MREMDFLEVATRPERIKIEEEKVEVVLEWPVPKSVNNVQKFLGLANYYRRFVKGFAKIVRLLHELITKLILIALDLDKKIRMEVDMLDYVTEEVLLMECSDRQWKLVAYLLKSLNETKKNYEI